MARTLKLTLPCILDLEPLGPCNSESLKQSKSSRSQMFFKICSLKNFAIFTEKRLCWGPFLKKLQAFKPAIFLKKESNKGVSWRYCKIFKSSFFIEYLWWLLLTAIQQCQLGCLFFDFAPPRAFDFDQKLT